jgi:hypothetical protein
MPYIYALCDPDTEEVRYVGKANEVRIRYSAHLLVKGRPNHHRIHWIQSLLRQGKSPVLQILEEVTEDTWVERERWWISEMKRQGVRLTNLTDGGEGLTGFVPTEEQRRKMSEAQKKRPPVSEETRHKLSVSISAYALLKRPVSGFRKYTRDSNIQQKHVPGKVLQGWE